MRSIRCLVVAVSLCAAAPASADPVIRLGLGADYLFNNERGEFNLTLAVGAHIAPFVQIGGRFGAMILTETPDLPDQVGVPLDFFIRANFNARRYYGVYLEGLVGPWIYFGDADPVRFHGAFGFGLRAGLVSFGIEAGWVDPDPMLGLRIAFAFF